MLYVFIQRNSYLHSAIHICISVYICISLYAHIYNYICAIFVLKVLLCDFNAIYVGKIQFLRPNTIKQV